MLRSLPHTISQTQVCELIQAEKTKVFQGRDDEEKIMRTDHCDHKGQGDYVERDDVTMESNVVCITRT